MVSTRRTTVVHPLLSVQGEWQPITQAAPVDSTMTSLEEVVEQTCPTIASVSVSIIGIIISFPLTGLHSQKLGYYFHLDFPRITKNLAKWKKKEEIKEGLKIFEESDMTKCLGDLFQNSNHQIEIHGWFLCYTMDSVSLLCISIMSLNANMILVEEKIPFVMLFEMISDIKLVALNARNRLQLSNKFRQVNLKQGNKMSL